MLGTTNGQWNMYAQRNQRKEKRKILFRKIFLQIRLMSIEFAVFTMEIWFRRITKTAKSPVTNVERVSRYEGWYPFRDSCPEIQVSSVLEIRARRETATVPAGLLSEMLSKTYFSSSYPVEADRT